VRSRRVPERGEIVWLQFNPRGHEQSGRRPAFVISPGAYNRRVGLALFCPITSQVKGYPFEVALPAEIGIAGVVLSDHVKSLDWRAHGAKRIAKAPQLVIDEVLGKLSTLVS